MNMQASDLTDVRLEHIVDDAGYHDIVLVSARLLGGRELTTVEVTAVNDTEDLVLDLIGKASFIGGTV